MTDGERQQAYAQRDEMRVEVRDTVQTVLHLVLEQTRAFNAAQESQAKRDEWLRARLERIDEDLTALRSHNSAQDRIQGHTSQIAEEALTLAGHPELRGDVRRQATIWGGVIAALVTIGPSVVQHLVAPLLERIGPY